MASDVRPTGPRPARRTAEQALMTALPLLVCYPGPPRAAHATTPVAAPASPSAASAASSVLLDVESLARSNPLGLLEYARGRCRATIRDYRCLFTRQERMHGRLLPAVTYEVLYRERPRSVLMTARSPNARARRVLYVAGARHDARGRETVLVEPTGLARLLTGRVELRLDDPRLTASSRKPIDQYGFASTLDRLVEVCTDARAAGALDLQYAGPGTIDGRPTLVLVRRLPYSAARERWPDGYAVIHLDREWLVPVTVQCYADPRRRLLIASYRSVAVEPNLGLGLTAFRF